MFAVVADPLALEQVDLAFLGVDAVLREDERHAAHLPDQAAQVARVAGGGAVHHAHAQHAAGARASIQSGWYMMRTVQK